MGFSFGMSEELNHSGLVDNYQKVPFQPFWNSTRHTKTSTPSLLLPVRMRGCDVITGNFLTRGLPRKCSVSSPNSEAHCESISWHKAIMLMSFCRSPRQLSICGLLVFVLLVLFEIMNNNDRNIHCYIDNNTHCHWRANGSEMIELQWVQWLREFLSYFRI